MVAAVVVVVLLAAAGVLDGLALEHGWLLDALVIAVIGGTVLAAVGHDRSWWRRWGLAVAATATVLVAGVAWWLGHSRLVVQHYPPTFYVWAWSAVWAVGVAVTAWRSGPAVLRVGRAASALLVGFAAFCLIQAHYGYWPTLGTLLDHPLPGQVSAATLAERIARPASAPGPAGATGTYGPATIPGGPGFDPGRVWVWLPPDFSRVPHATLPVLLLLPGTPGTAADWARSGQAVSVADHWARAHGGAAPVMVLINENGTGDHDTECVNGPQGDADTYFSQTVPAYLHTTLGIAPDPGRWAVVGFSEGGTCAVGLSIEHPDVYGRFVDLAGDLAPNYGHEQPAAVTVSRLYGGSRAAQEAHDPLHILATHRYRGCSGWFAAGRDDRQHAAVASTLARASRAAGVDVHLSEPAGGHNWRFASGAFAGTYPALVSSLGPPPPDRPQAGGPRAHHRRVRLVAVSPPGRLAASAPTTARGGGPSRAR